MEINKIYTGDCLEVLKGVESGSVDLVLTDPPYGKKWTRGKNGIGISKEVNENDKTLWDIKPSKEYFDEILRIGKKVIIWGGNYFTDCLYPTNCWLVWDKRGTFPRGEQIPFADCELAWTTENKTVKKFTLVSQGFVTEVKEKRVHPTQKPLELFKWCIELFTKEGDTVLDPYLGSGTTAVACKELGRNYIGIELDPAYVKIAENRLRATTTPLFTQPKPTTQSIKGLEDGGRNE